LPDRNHALWRKLAAAVSGCETSFEGFDGAEILKQASRHGVAQLLGLQVHAGTLGGLTVPVRKELKESNQAQVAFDLLANDSTSKALDLLAAHGIRALLLKGTPLAHLYYPKTYLRPRCDVDVYIDERQLKLCADLLADNDFALSGIGERKYSSGQFVAFTQPVANLSIHFDIHWKLSNRVMFSESLPFDACSEVSQPVPALGTNAHALSPIDLLLHACIHRIAHGRNIERNRLIWLYDIHLLCESFSDDELEQFQKVALQKKIGALCADALETVHFLFVTSLPGEFAAGLKGNRLNEPSAKLIHSSKLRWAWADMQALSNIREKAAFARELLFH